MLASGSRPPSSVGPLTRPPPFPPDPPDSLTPSLTLPSPSSVPSLPPSPFPTVLPLRANSPVLGARSLPPSQTGVSITDLLASYLITPKYTVQIPNLVTVQNPKPSPPQLESSILGSSPAILPIPDYPLPAAPPAPAHPPPPAPAHPPPKPSSWADKAKASTDKSLKRMSSSPPTLSPEGIPRVMIPDEVFQRGALQHKDFVVRRFFGRIPAFKTIQNVLNYLWGKDTKLEIHMLQSSRSVLVRIPSDYIRDKVLKKRIWYVDTAMFHVAQWSDGEVADTSSLEAIPI